MRRLFSAEEARFFAPSRSIGARFLSWCMLRDGATALLSTNGSGVIRSPYLAHLKRKPLEEMLK